VNAVILNQVDGQQRSKQRAKLGLTWGMAICCDAASNYPRAPVRQGLNEAATRMDGVFAQMLGHDAKAADRASRDGN
jgi:hypothetical protein